MSKAKKAEEVIKKIPLLEVSALIIKTIKFTKGGLSKEEAKELAQDLIDLGQKLLGEHELCK